MLVFHCVTSSYLLIRAKWSIRQAPYTAVCSLKSTISARINNLMLCSQIQSNLISTGLSQTHWVNLHQLAVMEDKKKRSTWTHCLAFSLSKHISAISESKMSAGSIRQKGLSCVCHDVTVVSLTCCWGLTLENVSCHVCWSSPSTRPARQ